MWHAARERILLLILFVCLVTYQGSEANAAEESPVVSIESGMVSGGVEEGVAYFKGIPYAAPPLGELRWRPPVSPDKWEGVREAKEYSGRAAQNGDLSVFAKAGGSEDCLYLNVFVPEEALNSHAHLPVFFWIHGGGLFVGSASDYNPIPLVRSGNAVGVTINYRLGAFGSFAHPAIDKEGHAVANYGLMDQIFALDWVQRNIDKFGGNPQDVTIAGESSGGQSVLALMTSPKAKDKFQSAIGMSACTVALHSDFTMYSLENAERQGVELAKAAGLENATADDLRKLSTEEILKVQKPFGTFIIEDDYVPEHIGDALRAGHVHPVTFVNGTVRNEGAFFAGVRESFVGSPMTAEEYPQAVQEFCSVFGEGTATKVLAEYPLKNYATPSEAYAAIVTDAWFAAPAAEVNRVLSDKLPVFAYEFDDQTAPYYLPTSFYQGAAHTYEIPYVFPGFHGSSSLSTDLNEAQQVLSEQMMKLWTHAGSLTSQKDWKPYTPKNGQYLHLSLPKAKMMTNAEFEKKHHVDFWCNLLS